MVRLVIQREATSKRYWLWLTTICDERKRPTNPEEGHPPNKSDPLKAQTNRNRIESLVEKVASK